MSGRFVVAVLFVLLSSVAGADAWAPARVGTFERGDTRRFDEGLGYSIKYVGPVGSEWMDVYRYPVHEALRELGQEEVSRQYFAAAVGDIHEAAEAGSYQKLQELALDALSFDWGVAFRAWHAFEIGGGNYLSLTLVAIDGTEVRKVRLTFPYAGAGDNATAAEYEDNALTLLTFGLDADVAPAPVEDRVFELPPFEEEGGPDR